MQMLAKIFMIALVQIFAENTIMTKGFGSSTMIISAKNKRYLFGFSICITYFTVITSILSFVVDKIFSNSTINYIYFPVIYVIIIGIVYVITLLILRRFINKLFVKVKKYVHLSAFNCAVFGALLTQNLKGCPITDYIFYGFGVGLGFFLSSYYLSIVYDKLNSDVIPKSFRGYPVMLIYIGIISMAFFGFIK